MRRRDVRGESDEIRNTRHNRAKELRNVVVGSAFYGAEMNV